MEKTVKIKLLSDEVSSKIAAGEVVERPSSVLKELLENSADAGAKTIKINIEEAGKKLIRVSDDGAGMSRTDLTNSVKRYATSKIEKIEDMDNLSSFGFRGEALYAVSAVSKLTIKTTDKETGIGSVLKCEGGSTPVISDSAPTPGTIIEVRDLFFNLPARRKFLKSDNAERGHILKTAEEFALSRFETALQINCEGKQIYSFQKEAGELKKSAPARAEIIFGKDAVSGLAFGEDAFSGLKLFISFPNKFAVPKPAQMFFVNGRAVSALCLRQALYRAAENYKPSNTGIFALAYFDMNPSDFDINVHPQKKEIKFRDEGKIFAGFNRAVVNAFSGIAKEGAAKTAPPVIKENPRSVFVPPASAPKMQEPPAFSFRAETPVFTPPAISQTREIKDVPVGGDIYLGQYGGNYLLFETSDGDLLMLDQHAAQERVLYEKYLAEFSSAKTSSQKFIVPFSVDVPASEIENIMGQAEWLNGMGFEITQFGPGSIMLRSAPAGLEFDDDSAKQFILSLAEELTANKLTTPQAKKELTAKIACKKSIKSGDRITGQGALALLGQLNKCASPKICPHGRPVSFVLQKLEIAKKFHRNK